MRIFLCSVFALAAVLQVSDAGGSYYKKKDQCSPERTDFLKLNREGPRCLDNNPLTIRITFRFAVDELCELDEESFGAAVLEASNNRLCEADCDPEEIFWESFTVQKFVPSTKCKKTAYSFEGPGDRQRHLQSSYSYLLGISTGRCNRLCPSDGLEEDADGIFRRTLLSSSPERDLEQIYVNKKHKKENKKKQQKKKERRRRKRNQKKKKRRNDQRKKPTHSWPEPTPTCGSTNIVETLNEFGFNIRTFPEIEQEQIDCDNRCPTKRPKRLGKTEMEDDEEVCPSTPLDYESSNDEVFGCPNPYGAGHEIVVGSPLCFETLECCGVPRCKCFHDKYHGY